MNNKKRKWSSNVQKSGYFKRQVKKKYLKILNSSVPSPNHDPVAAESVNSIVAEVETYN